MIKEQITKSMINTMEVMYEKQVNTKMFWAKVKAYELSKDAYFGKGLLIQDIQKLIYTTYVTAHDAIHRLLELGIVEKVIGPHRDTYVLNNDGKKRILKILEEQNE